MRAWEELLGNPKYQVMMFQAMAPPRAERMILFSTMAGLMMPVPIVWATCTPIKKAATKLKKAAQMTAYCGERTLVETMVEIELAAS